MARVVPTRLVSFEPQEAVTRDGELEIRVIGNRSAVQKRFDHPATWSPCRRFALS